MSDSAAVPSAGPRCHAPVATQRPQPCLLHRTMARICWDIRANAPHPTLHHGLAARGFELQISGVGFGALGVAFVGLPLRA